jgi:hypothetical protein
MNLLRVDPNFPQLPEQSAAHPFGLVRSLSAATLIASRRALGARALIRTGKYSRIVDPRFATALVQFLVHCVLRSLQSLHIVDRWRPQDAFVRQICFVGFAEFAFF